MAEFPAMPFWVADYKRDTEHLTYEEHGLYINLLFLLWDAPGQRIPNDPEWIERRFRGYATAVRRLIDEFCQRDGNWITQKKVSRVFQGVAEKCEKQSVRAKVRWDNEKDICRGIAVAMPSKPKPKEERKKEEEVRKKRAINGNRVWVGEVGKRKPRHRQLTKDRSRIWLDIGTEDFEKYLADYWDKHHAAVPLLWHDSGAWFNTIGEVN